MPGWVAAILRNNVLGVAARAVATFYFWASGLEKFESFPAGVLGEMRHFNLTPAWLFAAATIITLFVGSALVIHGRWAWIGAGWLSVFTLLTLPMAHNFWAMSGEMAVLERRLFWEHITLIGGLFLAACHAHRARS